MIGRSQQTLVVNWAREPPGQTVNFQSDREEPREALFVVTTVVQLLGPSFPHDHWEIKLNCHHKKL